jgi:hypothetical protein
MGRGSPVKTGKFNSFEDFVDPLGVFHEDPRGPELNDQIQTGQHDAAMAETSKQYADAAQAGTLDSTTNNEITNLLEGGDPYQAGRILAAAKKGTGVYAVRKINENQKKLIDARPGRAQLSQRYSLIS